MNPTTILAIYNFRMRTSLVRFLWDIASNRGTADYSPTGAGALPTGQVGGTWRDANASHNNPIAELDSGHLTCVDNHCQSQDYAVSQSA